MVIFYGILYYLVSKEERNIMGSYEEQRKFLKSNFNEFKNIKTDKMKGIPQPDSVKYYSS